MARVQPVLDISKMGKCCQKKREKNVGVNRGNRRLMTAVRTKMAAYFIAKGIPLGRLKPLRLVEAVR